MSETPKRFTLRGRLHSAQELQEAQQRADHQRGQARLPGEGLHEYVRRVSDGGYQLIRSQDLHRLNEELVRLRRDSQALAASMTRNRLDPERSPVAVDTEERLMVGGPVSGRVLRFNLHASTYVQRELTASSDFRIAVPSDDRTTLTNYHYVLVRRAGHIPYMILDDLLNAPRSVQDDYVRQATRTAGIQL